MRITAKFNGKCAQCQIPTKRGEEIEYREGKAFCLKCGENEENPNDNAEQLALADKLGFIAPNEPIPASWLVWKVPNAN